MQIPTIYGYTLTQILIIAGVVFYSVYDVIAKLLWGNEHTITYTFQRACDNDWRVAVIAGLIFAHIFLSHSPG